MAENFSKEIQESQYILSKINITHTHTHHVQTTQKVRLS